ncbi:MAG: ABC transporter substrate-binding protein [Dehalococcoidia bacterium]|nr:ABC transporter substrate-binding protein [Dehalococcoidia bacterium]
MENRKRLFPASSGPLSRRRMLGGTLAAGTGLSAAALVGCGGDDDDDDSAAGTGDPASATATPATEVSNSNEADYPEEFVFALATEPEDLMPYYGGFDHAIALRSVNETLMNVVVTDDDGDGVGDVEFLPELAESWEQTDEDLFVFHLRPGVKFHDGTPWNAETAVSCIETFMDADAAAELGKYAMIPRYLANAEAVDERTLQVRTLRPMVARELFGFAFYFGFSAFSPQALEELGMQGMGEAPIGTGPYRFESWDRGQDIRMVRNEAYWGELPNMERLRFIARQEASVRAQTVQSGEAHLAFNIGAEQGTSLEHSVVGGGFQSTTLRLNNQVGPTSDQRVREAINYAIDREGINEAIFLGTAQPIGFFAYQAPVEPWPYDPERARALVQEAGVEGQRLELVYGEMRIPEEDSLAEIYREQLQAVGLDVELRRVESGQYSEIDQGPIEDLPPLFMETTSGGNYGELHLHLTGFYGCEGQGTFCDPELEEEFDELLQLEGEERRVWIEDLATRIHDENAPRAWVLAVNQVHGLAPNVETDFGMNVYVNAKDISWV